MYVVILLECFTSLDVCQCRYKLLPSRDCDNSVLVNREDSKIIKIVNKARLLECIRIAECKKQFTLATNLLCMLPRITLLAPIQVNLTTMPCCDPHFNQSGLQKRFQDRKQKQTPKRETVVQENANGGNGRTRGNEVHACCKYLPSNRDSCMPDDAHRNFAHTTYTQARIKLHTELRRRQASVRNHGTTIVHLANVKPLSSVGLMRTSTRQWVSLDRHYI